MINIGVLLADSSGYCKAAFLDLAQEMNVNIFPCENVTDYNARETVERLIREHDVEILIVRNPLAFYVERYSPIPLIRLDIMEIDIIRAIRSAPAAVKAFAYFVHTSDIEKYFPIRGEIEEMTGRRCKMIEATERMNYSYEALDELFSEVQDCDAVVTGTKILGDIFAAHGKQVLYVSADRHRLKEALENAVNMAMIQRRNRKLQRINEWTLDSTKDFYIVFENGLVEMISRRLLAYLEIREDPVGRSERELFAMHPFLEKVRQAQDGGIIGYKGSEFAVSCTEEEASFRLLTVSNVERIQAREHYVRTELTKSGFDAKHTFRTMIAQDPLMLQVKRTAQRYAASGANILVTGESGAGKEVIVQSIHNASAFAGGPFVAVNCAAIPEQLLESELFGYEGGAFTGARREGRRGMFELSHNGTLFLDEIGELPLHVQAKLLRCIQEHVVSRVGSERVIPIRNRLICATNKNLREQISRGLFREDLYYRINVLRLRLPSLRQRRGDIGPLAQTFWAAVTGGRGEPLPEWLLRELEAREWPGNVRELDAFIQRLAAITDRPDRRDPYLRELLRELENEHGAEEPSPDGQRDREDVCTVRSGTLEEMEREIISKTYRACGGNMQQTARQLAIGYSTVRRKLEKDS